MIVQFFLLAYLAYSVSGQNEFCDMCAGSGIPANSALIVPFLAIGDNKNPTCKEVFDFANEAVRPDYDICSLIKSHKDFCGCPFSSTTPLNSCSLCPEGATPMNLNAVTPFEDTCSELDTYLKYLPADLCLTERVGSIMRTDAFCGCPGVKAECFMCDDDTNNLSNPDRKLPFYQLLGISFSSTCQDLADFYTLYDIGDPEISNCQFLKFESRYCGCQSEPDSSPVNACKLCSDGSAVSEADKYIPEIQMTCGELEVYIDYLPADQCAELWVTELTRFDYFCGCANATANCPMCPDGSIEISNPDAIIPYLNFPNNVNPTCQQLATLGVIADAGDLDVDGCGLYEAQANFCGCPGATKPEGSCEFCPGGDSPTNPSLVTPYGDTCEELSEYLSFLPADECDSDRVEFVKRQDFLCGCPSATCELCSNHGSNDVEYTDRHIPLLRLTNNENPTCGEIVEFLSVNDSGLSVAGCFALQEYQGYCGCPKTLAKKECSFCPNGEPPSNPNKVVSGVYTCQGLSDFVSFLRADECGDSSSDFKQIQAFAYVCGCPGALPSCTLCPAGMNLPSPSMLIGDNQGTTCSEHAEYVASLSGNECFAQKNEIQATASVCGCGNPVAPPAATSDVTSSLSDDDYDYDEGIKSSEKIKQQNQKNKNIVIIIAVIVPVVLALLTIIYYFFAGKSSHQDSKIVLAKLNGTESEGLPLPVEVMEGSISMSDIPIPSPEASPPPSESFSIDENEIPVDTDPDRQIV